MKKKQFGFTLIELLVVVGVLVAYGPQYIQNAKQKSTMKDINVIATACVNYTSINGKAPASGIQEGILRSSNEFIMAIAPEHMPVCPIKDKWGNPYVIYTGIKTALFKWYKQEVGKVLVAALVVKTDGTIVQNLTRYALKEDDEKLVKNYLTNSDFFIGSNKYNKALKILEGTFNIAKGLDRTYELSLIK